MLFFCCPGGEGVSWSKSQPFSVCLRLARAEEWCMAMAVSGWFGLCSLGGQAPAQIKDFSVKVPGSATAVCMCACVSLCLCD